MHPFDRNSVAQVCLRSWNLVSGNSARAVARAVRTVSIVAADRMVRALGTTLAEMFRELGRPDQVSHRAAVP